MKHVLTDWNEFVELFQSPHGVLFLDYDGTLTPIVEDPDQAILSEEAKVCLQDLCAVERLSVVVISGRSLKDVKARIRVPQVIYAGNHGLELEGPGIHYLHPEAKAYIPLLKKMDEELSAKLSSIKGVHVENKSYTLSIHYRNAAAADVPQARKIYLEILQPYLKKSAVILAEGKMVWEIRPPIAWDKGKMVLWFLERITAQFSGRPVEPLYIGDDQTDEHALEAIRGRGIGIKVSEEPPQNSFASWYLKDSAEVLLFLKKLKQYKSGEKHAKR